MLTFGMTGSGGFDPLVLLLLALVVEAYVGEAKALFKAVPHPVRIIGNLVGFFDRKLNRESRSPADRAIRGALVVVIVAGLAFERCQQGGTSEPLPGPPGHCLRAAFRPDDYT